MALGHASRGTACNCGMRGWLPGIEHLPILWARPAHIVREAGQMRPYVVVDHIAQGFIRTIDAWAANAESRIITHFGVERGGRKVQYQDIYTEGIHVSSVTSPSAAIVQRLGSVAGRGVNPYGIGIEHEGFSVDPVAYAYDYLYSRSSPWPEAMVRSSIEIKRWIFAQPDTNLGPPSRDTIIGHYEADLRNRIDDPVSRHDRSVWPRDRMVAELAPKAPPKPKPDPEEDEVSKDYTMVYPGEWLSVVANRTGVSVAELVRLNGIADANRIEAFQALRLNEGVPLPPPPWGAADAVDLAAMLRSTDSTRERILRIQERHK